MRSYREGKGEKGKREKGKGKGKREKGKGKREKGKGKGKREKGKGKREKGKGNHHSLLTIHYSLPIASGSPLSHFLHRWATFHTASARTFAGHLIRHSTKTINGS